MDRVEIRVFQAKDSPRKTVLFLISLLGISLIFGVFFGLFWGIFSFLFILFTNYQFWIPTNYLILDDQIEVRRWVYKRKRSIKEFKRVENLRDGVFLGTLEKPSFVDSYRGLFIPIVDEKLRERVYKLLKMKVLTGKSDDWNNKEEFGVN